MRTLICVLVLLNLSGCIIVPQENKVHDHPINVHGPYAQPELYPEGANI